MAAEAAEACTNRQYWHRWLISGGQPNAGFRDHGLISCQKPGLKDAKGDLFLSLCTKYYLAYPSRGHPTVNILPEGSSSQTLQVSGFCFCCTALFWNNLDRGIY